MADQKTRNNHYVPQWYQRGFLAPGQSRLFHLNLDLDRRTLLDGRQVPRKALHEWGPVNCFVEYDLYTTHFGSIVNDDIEKHLFGVIDDQAAKAVHAFAKGDHAEVHDSFEDFLEHMAAQKLRTPKGLDWIRSCYGQLDQIDLMVEMLALRTMQCTMWAEGVREIVSAADSEPPMGGLHQRLKLAEDEGRRMIRMLPEDSLRRHIAKHTPDADDAMVEQMVAYFRRQAENDPYLLLQPPQVGEAGAQHQIYKGLNLESALYLATLTGSIIHVDTDAHWEQLLKDVQPPGAASQRTWAPVRQALAQITFPVDLNPFRVAGRLTDGELPPINALLRRLADSIASPNLGVTPKALATQLRQACGKAERKDPAINDNNMLTARLELHVPPAGFFRHEVQRLLVMFAGTTRPRSVPYALRLVFDEAEADDADAPKPASGDGGIPAPHAAQRR